MQVPRVYVILPKSSRLVADSGFLRVSSSIRLIIHLIVFNLCHIQENFYVVIIVICIIERGTVTGIGKGTETTVIATSSETESEKHTSVNENWNVSSSETTRGECSNFRLKMSGNQKNIWISFQNGAFSSTFVRAGVSDGSHWKDPWFTCPQRWLQIKEPARSSLRFRWRGLVLAEVARKRWRQRSNLGVGHNPPTSDTNWRLKLNRNSGKHTHKLMTTSARQTTVISDINKIEILMWKWTLIKKS